MKITVCDNCGRDLMPDFFDSGYKVTVKKLNHSYDGYAPWIRKTKLELCLRCWRNITDYVVKKGKK